MEISAMIKFHRYGEEGAVRFVRGGIACRAFKAANPALRWCLLEGHQSRVGFASRRAAVEASAHPGQWFRNLYH
jgi:hypothetical protein